VLALVLAAPRVIPASAAPALCATPGRDGTATLSGVVNTYYPGTATAAAGSTSVQLGAAAGAATPVAAGDLLLVIQVQDAAIDSTNTGAYGDGTVGDPATGSTNLNASGRFEYAVAASAVPLGGGTLTLASGLINTYTAAAPTGTQGQRTFQVIRVPQYAAATLTSTLAAAPFNGSTGGVLAIDVAGALALNGATVSVDQAGFRGGLGRQLAGGAGGSGTDYVNLSANPFHGQKGEGIAGTPHYVYDSRAGAAVNTGQEGYPGGATARGAPGTAGGGGTDPNPAANDQNTGGGGGANGGAGGQGGNSWFSNLPRGGFGGTAFTAGVTRVALGAGGGAGSRNNSPAITNASSGGNGGGLVAVRTGTIAGAGTISANGGTGVAPLNDGGGGGGAGGSVMVVAQFSGVGALTVNARGGVGTDTWPADAGGPTDYHGPGGGGGGGVILTSGAPASFDVSGAANGTTTTDKAAYGATPGAIGLQALIAANQIPGAGSGAACSPDLTIAKSHSGTFVRGSTGSYSLTVTNIGGTATVGPLTVSDTLPTGLTPLSASGTGWICVTTAPSVSCTRSDALAAAASYQVITVTVSVAQSAASSVSNSASVAGGGEVNTSNDAASDPTAVTSQADIAVSKSAGASTITVGSNVTFTITAHNAGPSDATGVQVTDVLPAGLSFVSANPAAGTYTSSTGVWNIGPLAAGATTTLGLTATVTATGAITNSATKTGEVEIDPNGSNNTASTVITGRPTSSLPAPPNGGMASVASVSVGASVAAVSPRVLVPALSRVASVASVNLGGAAVLVALMLLAASSSIAVAGRRRSHVAPAAALARVAPAAAVAAMLAVFAWPAVALHQQPAAPAQRLSAPAPPTFTARADTPDTELFGKALISVPALPRTTVLHAASGPVTPSRLRIPSLGIDTAVEGVGVRSDKTMDVPANIWNAAWLRTSVRPGATGQAVMDGHLDSVLGAALFGNLHRLHRGDSIYVSDAAGNELTFRVMSVAVVPREGFPAVRVFGPASGRFLNLITCAGRYEPGARSYDHRLVVFATLV
jgi:uncharacterized repeat protein (TIGR01451 family)